MPDLRTGYLLEAPDAPARVAVGGLWSLNYDQLTLVDAAWSGRPVVLVPTEDVRLLAVDLPIANRAQRLTALPFAIEDDLAEPIEVIHAALGIELVPGRYLAGAVRHEKMLGWLALIADAGLDHAGLVPDALALPIPGEGGWSVAVRAGRALVRTAAGPAFAAPLGALEVLWRTAGEPRVMSYGEALADGMVGEGADDGWSTWPVLSQPLPLDLRQGRYGAVSTTTPWLRRAAMVLGIGLLAHAVLYAIDTVALMQTADDGRTQVETLVTAAGGPPGGDVAATAEAMLPASGGASSGLLPTMSRVGLALQPLGSAVSVSSMTWADEGGLMLALEASDLAALQGAVTALTSAGLAPTSGGANVEGGRARQQVTLPSGVGPSGAAR